ncbi:hypothetical protein Hanom_Chr11g01010521 [Helianthus anomalus]
MHARVTMMYLLHQSITHVRMMFPILKLANLTIFFSNFFSNRYRRHYLLIFFICLQINQQF